MATTSKKKATTKQSVKKKAVTKKVVKKKVVNTGVVKKEASKKKPASIKKKTVKKATPKSKNASSLDITAEERWKMIAIAAYHKAEKRNFAPGNEQGDWAAAEKEIEKLLNG